MYIPTITTPRPIAVSTNEVEPGSSQRSTSATIGGPMPIPSDQAKLNTRPQDSSANRRNAPMKLRKLGPSIAWSIGRMIVLSIPKRPEPSPAKKADAASAHSSAVMTILLSTYSDPLPVTFVAYSSMGADVSLKWAIFGITLALLTGDELLRSPYTRVRRIYLPHTLVQKPSGTKIG